MTKLNGITDIVLAASCLFSLFQVSIRSSAWPAFFAGFGSIAIAAGLGAAYFSGIQEVRKYHLLMIHVSSSLGIVGIGLGHTQTYFGLSREASMTVLATVLMFLLYVYYQKTDVNLSWVPIVTVFALTAFCFQNARWKTLFGVVGMIAAAKCKEKHVKVWKFDEIDVFHLILSVGVFFLAPDVSNSWW